MTINKTQGQTILNVGIYLHKLVFFHGPLYVAVSRCVSHETTWVLVRAHKAINPTGNNTKNIVYMDVLES
jgi:ATP-dependent DNA helicase PIF1